MRKISDEEEQLEGSQKYHNPTPQIDETHMKPDMIVDTTDLTSEITVDTKMLIDIEEENKSNNEPYTEIEEETEIQFSLPFLKNAVDHLDSINLTCINPEKEIEVRQLFINIFKMIAYLYRYDCFKIKKNIIA